MLTMLLLLTGTAVQPVTAHALELLESESVLAEQFQPTLIGGCSEEPGCFGTHWAAFGRVRDALRDDRRSKSWPRIRALVEENTYSDGRTNWQLVSDLAKLTPPTPSFRPPRYRVTCSTWVSKHGRHATTTCY